MSNTDHGHHVLDQTFSAPHGQGQSKADTTTLERSTPPASTIGEAPTVEDRPPPSVEGSDDPSTTPLAPQSPDQSVEDDPKAYPEGGLRAWLVVLGSFSGMAASFGLMNTVGTFQAYLITHQLASYPPSAVGWIFGLYVFLSFFCGVQIGPIFDAKGPRWIVVSGTICLLTGMVGLAFSTGMYGPLPPPLRIWSLTNTPCCRILALHPDLFYPLRPRYLLDLHPGHRLNCTFLLYPACKCNRHRCHRGQRRWDRLPTDAASALPPHWLPVCHARHGAHKLLPTGSSQHPHTIPFTAPPRRKCFPRLPYLQA